MKLYAREGSFRAQKVIVAAQYAGASLSVETGASEKDLKGKAAADRLPLLETAQGCLFESNAIMKFVASGNKALVGADSFTAAQIESWIDFCANEIEVPATMWTYPIVGYMDNYPEVTQKAEKDLKAALAVLEEHLKTETFLVGRAVTLADIAVACALALPMKLVLDDKARKPFPCVARWFATCANQPEFLKVVGPVTLIKKAVASKKAAPAPKAAAEPKAAKASKKKDDDEDDGPMDDTPKEEKPKDLLALLPKSSFILDAWKRAYSNAEDGDCYKAMPWFWENLDKEGYSMYFTKYNYNDELKVPFQVSNLVGGFMQRCDEIRKYAFGTLQIIGDDEGKMEIVGCWLFRGPDEQPILNCNPDAEYHTWTKITDLDDEATKTKVADYWCAENQLEGKKIFDCKVFK